MAINPAFLTCVVCDTPHARPFDFHKTPEQQAAMEALREERRQQSARGWTGPQYLSHETRALLCDAHHDEADALGLSAVPIGEGLARLRGER